MNPHLTPLRRALLAPAALVLAAVFPCAAQAQPACAAGLPNGGTGSCTIGGYTAQFASATGSIDPSTQTITLNGGWVWVTPNGNGNGGSRAAGAGGTGSVIVKTQYIPDGVIAPAAGPNAPSLLVVAYANRTTVAVVSGTLQTPVLGAGCEVYYQNASSGQPGTAFALATDADTTGILNQLGVSYPSTCTP